MRRLRKQHHGSYLPAFNTVLIEKVRTEGIRLECRLGQRSENADEDGSLVRVRLNKQRAAIEGKDARCADGGVTR